MNNESLPQCYGHLDTVFPKMPDGFRSSPEPCMVCVHKTQCLRTAIQYDPHALNAKNEMVDRAYESGIIGFWNRWSQKKKIHNQIKIVTQKTFDS